MERGIKLEEKKLTVVNIYRKRRKRRGWRRRTGDYNAWTRELGRGEWREEERYKRSSKHKEVDKEGRKLLNVLKGTGWRICNVNLKGDKDIFR